MLITSKQAALLAGITLSRFLHIMCAGEGPTPTKRQGKGPGGSYHFEASVVERWIEARRLRRAA